jgi:NAD(P)-dependent dehydrogenase (short-subunit alcohol dehydrogenase family)
LSTSIRKKRRVKHKTSSTPSRRNTPMPKGQFQPLITHVLPPNHLLLTRAYRPPKVTAHYADVSDPASVDACLAEIIAAHGRIDNLVTSAGFTENFEAVAYPIDRMRKLWGVNVDGTYLFATGVARHLVRFFVYFWTFEREGLLSLGLGGRRMFMEGEEVGKWDPGTGLAFRCNNPGERGHCGPWV